MFPYLIIWVAYIKWAVVAVLGGLLTSARKHVIVISPQMKITWRIGHSGNFQGSLPSRTPHHASMATYPVTTSSSLRGTRSSARARGCRCSTFCTSLAVPCFPTGNDADILTRSCELLAQEDEAGHHVVTTANNKKPVVRQREALKLISTRYTLNHA
ncbi:hypothetical protein CALVIDRAFT_431138 [Calocera viscosa TUFC12733]|uniref:Uncharacterized protein n=1 Tax=Calocera viscosa (strain TUFC12733) TaxID=1330018 RepID=A0A167FZF3_CALVF|nr:hypothetical protein CALVIDRAFT_431138 [Calocera viscosa TUFC12733]